MRKPRQVRTWVDTYSAGCVVCQVTAPEGEDLKTWARKHVEENEGHATLVMHNRAYTTNPMMAPEHARIVPRLGER